MKICCPCDELKHPAKPEITAGLPSLRRQLAGFPEFRVAMLRDIPKYAALHQWRAREGNDLGIMLLEMWAYVLDVIGFYDERIANESYLRTAVNRSSLRKLVALIGYQPRPALAAFVELAAIADGNQPVTLPPGTGFRSDAFNGEPPQVFETEIEHTIHSIRNEWTLAPLRGKSLGKALLFEPGTAALAEDQIILLRWRRKDQKRMEQRAGKVTDLQMIDALDGERYLKVEISPSPALDPALLFENVDVLSPRLNATLNRFAADPIGFFFVDPAVGFGDFKLPSQNLETTTDVFSSKPVLLDQSVRNFSASLQSLDASPGTFAAVSPQLRIRVILDAIYPQFAEQDSIVIQRGSAFIGAMITAVETVSIKVSPAKDAPTIPATSITFQPALLSEWKCNPLQLVVHFDMTSSGTLTRIAKTHLGIKDFTAPGAAIDGVVEPLPDSVPSPSRLLFQDAMDNGALVYAAVHIDDNGSGHIRVNDDTQTLDPKLRTPITVFGNVVRATRGESVFNEVLGSGDTSLAFQSFTLTNKPLTYFNDPSAPSGRRSTLEVRVNGIKWKEVPSFFGMSAQDEVYIVRQNDEEETIVTFGDGQTGVRLPTGVDNITATYRFGAGAAKPPAGAIGQMARPVQGLRGIASPVAPGGGADADRLKDIRKNAPNSALLLGRAVSLLDFEALAREFGGVVNAHVEWTWDDTCQSAVVKVWFISDGGDIADVLKPFLIGQADPSMPLVAMEAQAKPARLVLDMEIDQRFNAQTIIDQVNQVLVNQDTGILALENIPIGCPLFRSQILDQVLSVEGVHSVRAMTVDGQPTAFAMTVQSGQYLDFIENLTLSATAVKEGIRGT